MVEYLGLWVLLALTLNMWALQAVLGSASRWTVKTLWAALLIAVPGLGFLAWYLLGPRSAQN